MKNMGVRWFFLLWMFFCVCTLRFISVAAETGYTMCDIQECNCTIKVAPWKVINCSLHEGQVVNLENANVPKEAFEIYINGGRELTFSTKTFKEVPALSFIYLNGIQRVVMEKKSFYYITSSSLLIQIQNCDELIIKTGAFEYLQSSVSIEVFNVHYVSVEPAAFSKLDNSTFKNVKLLKLYERSFDFKNQKTIASYGPVTVIIFDNVEIPKIPREVFLQSLASVSFQNCKIGVILTDAFKATQISSIVLINSSIENIQAAAFAERSLICDFKISKCNISRIQSKAVFAAFGNFSLSHSIVTDIESGAINATIARSEISHNQIFNIYPSGITIHSWNFVSMDKNIIKNLHRNFLTASHGNENEKLSFKGNDVYAVEEGALSFLSNIDSSILTFDDNFFNQSCDCSIDHWIEKVASINQIPLIKDTSFCTVNELLSKCFSLPIGTINIQNFTEKACKNLTICEPYEGKTRVVDTTSKIFLEEDDSTKQNWLIFMLTIIGLFVLAILVTFIILIVRGSRWLKEKGYFRNVHYNNNDLSIEEEGTVVTVDENEKLEIPEELTLEFLQVLAKRLDDPNTHQDASEMIERLYEMFIIDDGYENNNRQEEEAHLYEELGNLNLQIPPPPYEEEKESSSGARSILKLMEEKFTQQAEPSVNGKPSLVGEYSEPTDAAVHLYSELKNKTDKSDNSKSSTDCLKPSETLNNVKNDWLSLPGPSTKL
ncbi:uncharacterized protein LOC126889924 isoform X1 [Diabrotica virgifera virgifera]|uniref:Uncharacterized protein n=2 Tax=Diabrotica virgifera virgifera TaxID=50390 RepID=A0ABM5KWQ1_DIAVI|nr:uncharacterized protein LOC126889924 isoform X1 [Diabrotica virgifera virgifera]